jgi:putative phage-type endonuclease
VNHDTIPLGHARPIIELDAIDRDQWLDARRAGIGGSDAAAICGLDDYRSAFEVWLDKTGVLVDDTAGEAAAWGAAIEPLVADAMATRETIGLVEVPWMLAHPERPWMLANIDRVAIDPRRDGPGVGECKTTSVFRAAEWREAVPAGAMCQAQHYMAVTGFEWAIIGTLLGGQRLVINRVERDDALIDHLVALEERFWDHVTRRDPPGPDGSRSTAALLGRLYEVEVDRVETVHRAEVADVLAALSHARARQNAAEDDRRRAEAELKVLMGPAELLVDVEGDVIARWPQVKSDRIDVAALRRDHPTLAAQYSRTTTSRRFTTPPRS